MSSGSRKDTRLVVGGSPRADLLPPEIKRDKVARRQRRGLIAIVVLVVALVVVGYGASTVAAVGAQTRLEAANARTGALVSEKSQYSEVTQVQSNVNTAKAAITVGSSAELNWSVTMLEILSTLPAGATVTTMSAVAASPMATYAQATAPLQPFRMSEVVLSVRLAQFAQLSPWLDDLEATVTGFADAGTATTTLTGDGDYLVTLTLHLDAGALLKRYDENGTQIVTLDTLLVRMQEIAAARAAAAPPAAPVTTDEDEDE